MEFLQNFHHLRRGLWVDYAEAIRPFYEQPNDYGGVLLWEDGNFHPFRVVWWRSRGVLKRAGHAEPNGRLADVQPMDCTEALWWISQDQSKKMQEIAEEAYEMLFSAIREILPVANCFPGYLMSASEARGFILLKLPCWKSGALLATKNSFMFIRKVSSTDRFKYHNFISPVRVEELFARELAMLRNDHDGALKILTTLAFPREVGELNQPISPSCLIA